MYRKRKKSILKHMDFVIIDFFLLVVSFLVTYTFRFNGSATYNTFFQGADKNGHSVYVSLLQILLLINVVIDVLAEPYSGILRRNAAQEVKKIIEHNLYLVLGCIVILFAVQSSQTYSRIVVFTFAIVNSFLMSVVHYCYKRLLIKEINKKSNQECMLLVAPYRQISNIVRRFNKKSVGATKIVGVILTETKAQLEAVAGTEVEVTEHGMGYMNFGIMEIPIVGCIEDLYTYAKAHIVDEVLICAEDSNAEEIAAGFMDMGIMVHISIQNLIRLPKATMNQINGIPVVTAGVNTITTRQLAIKRIVDIVCGLIGSVVTIFLTLIIAPMLWIADPGPIFFRQERVGRNGRTFKIWKFRTMYTDAEARKAELMKDNKMSGLMFKMDNDPRIIGAGKRFSLGDFLRKTSIDELPQSFNILAGSMSVVGTRPPTVNEYKEYELHHKGRLAMKPGLTGMWQVSGRSDITDFEEIVRLDKEYINNFSLLLDLEIMLKTFKVVLGREGSV